MSATGTKKKKVMSVREMGELLGIGKSDRYWLLKKGYFKLLKDVVIGLTSRSTIARPILYYAFL